ncbi:MAG: hypothetical protein HY300_02630 [Verrucomicrobia bacterium]|nr:hypothetical protein [Verrucomicrobiota bacterium]
MNCFHFTKFLRLALPVAAAMLFARVEAQVKPGQRAQIRQDSPAIPLPGRGANASPPTPSPFVTKPATNGVFDPRASLPKQSPAPAMMRPFNIDAATAVLLADTRAFTARAEMEMAFGPPTARETNTVPIVVFFNEGRLRTDLDLTQVRSPSGLLPAFTGLLALDVVQIRNIVRPDKRVMHLVYPGTFSYTDLPLLPEECNHTLKIERGDIGHDAALGQPCQKQKITVTYANNDKHEAMVWFSDTLRGFPVQIQWLERSATVTLRYLEVNMAVPALNVFEPPSSFMRYADQPTMLQSAMQRKLDDPKSKRASGVSPGQR